MPSKHFSAVEFFVIVLIITACLFSGCEPGGIIDEPDLSHDSRLVGDWQTIYEDDDGTGIEITTLTASGDMTDGGFLQVGDYWIESWENIGTWRASNDTLFESYVEFGVSGTDTLLYSISGNRITLSICDKKSCDTTVAEKVDAAAVRNGLGTVRNQNAALFTSHAYTDLMWLLESNKNDTLDFDMMYFWNGERYFGDDWYYDGYGWCNGNDCGYDYYTGYLYCNGDDCEYYEDPVWYTTADRLFLVLTSNGEIGKTVELKYEIAGNGSNARLLISPVLEDGSLGPEDIWLPAEYEDNGWGFYKAKQSKKAARKHKRAFSLARRLENKNQKF